MPKTVKIVTVLFVLGWTAHVRGQVAKKARLLFQSSQLGLGMT